MSYDKLKIVISRVKIAIKKCDDAKYEENREQMISFFERKLERLN